MGQKQKAALYIRVSTLDQSTHGYSLDAQRALLEDYAAAHGMDVVDVYADEGKSASKSLDKRTELLRLLEDAKRGRFSVVLFKDITRWSRNAAAYYKVQEVLDAAKVGWLAVEQPYLETMTPTGRFQVSVMLGTAQLEAEQTGQRIKFVQEAEVKRGHYPFPPHCAPTGYTTEKREDGNYLVIDPETAPIVRTIFSTFRVTYNLQRCVEAVREKHGIEYSETTVNRILRNPIYKGEFRGLPGVLLCIALLFLGFDSSPEPCFHDGRPALCAAFHPAFDGVQNIFIACQVETDCYILDVFRVPLSECFAC